MTVNSMTPQTARAAAALEQELFSAPWREADFLSSLTDENRLFLTCTDAGALIGYCGMQWAAEQADILTIGVRPAFRRQGVGETLLREVIAAGEHGGSGCFFWKCSRSNLAAQRLYEKAGFRQNGCRKGYYQNPAEDGLVYILEV